MECSKDDSKDDSKDGSKDDSKDGSKDNSKSKTNTVKNSYYQLLIWVPENNNMREKYVVTAAKHNKNVSAHLLDPSLTYDAGFD